MYITTNLFNLGKSTIFTGAVIFRVMTFVVMAQVDTLFQRWNCDKLHV